MLPTFRPRATIVPAALCFLPVPACAPDPAPWSISAELLVPVAPLDP